jgi:hypothetical protein
MFTYISLTEHGTGFSPYPLPLQPHSTRFRRTEPVGELHGGQSKSVSCAARSGIEVLKQHDGRSSRKEWTWIYEIRQDPIDFVRVCRADLFDPRSSDWLVQGHCVDTTKDWYYSRTVFLLENLSQTVLKALAKVIKHCPMLPRSRDGHITLYDFSIH